MCFMTSLLPCQYYIGARNKIIIKQISGTNAESKHHNFTENFVQHFVQF